MPEGVEDLIVGFPEAHAISLFGCCPDARRNAGDREVFRPAQIPLRNDDDATSLQEVRDRLQFLADSGYDLRHNLPD